MVTEFDIIRDYFFPLGPQNFPVSHPHWQLIVGNGDDCAVIQTECPLVFSIDTQVDQVHFLNSMHPSHIAYRGLAAALSDLAAMGAEPVFYTLALTLTGQESAAWIQDYVSGLHTLSSQLNCPLVGGDTTQGSCLVQTFQVHGVIPEGAPITRQGARPGDKVWVTGTLGDAAAGLDFLTKTPANDSQSQLLDRYHRPSPRIQWGQAMRPLATAGIDISDGLVADLGHICERSQVGAHIHCERLPLSLALRDYAQEPWRLGLTGGDDYELCICLPPELDVTPFPFLTEVGEIVTGRGVSVVHKGQEVTLNSQGFDHFAQ